MITNLASNFFNNIERDEKYRNVLHQNDVWHGGENIAKKINTVSIKAMHQTTLCLYFVSV